MGFQQTQNKLVGLTFQEAALRLKKFGPNELKKYRGYSSLKIFLNQFKSPLIYILVFAGLVTFFLRDFTDAIVIFAAVVLNTTLGFYQEQKSQKSMAALRSLITPVARVIRDGEQKIIDVRNLVLGDLVVLTIGVKIPADGILVESKDLTIDEAILTGESMPVTKKSGSFLGISESATDKQHQMVFMGATVVTGIAKMMVTKTGMATRVGKMEEVMRRVKEEKTPLQIQIGKLARILAVTIGIVTVFIFLFGKFLGYDIFQIFTTSVAVAVAAIPEGLVVTLTVILALGMQRILKRKALVRELLATEILGSVSTICADKTGTLTEGKMKVVEALIKGEKQKLIEATVLCNDMRDPLEVAMMNWAKKEIVKTKTDIQTLNKKYLKLDEIPFNPSDKYIVTLHKEQKTQENFLFFSGAPEIILNKSKFKSSKEKEELLKKFKEYGQRGYRLVGFAYKKLKSQATKIKKDDLKAFVWLGILIYEDPIRTGVKEALEECQQAGIKVKVITGDYLETAIAVIAKLGIKNHQKVIEGSQLTGMSDEELKKTVGEVVLFARTTPEHKLKIVQALKESGEVVAMMGDGVNDAPALKQADIGIVVKSAADVAKETADMVLLDSNFATIVHAIEEGRSIFENIKKATFYLLSHSFMEIILISGSLLFRLPLPITAVQILWINLFQDSLPAIALAFEPKESHLMDEPPREKETPIINFQIKILLALVGILGPVFLTILIIASLKNFLVFHFSQTLVFAALGTISMFVVLACRSLKQAFRYNLWQNPALIGALLISLLLLLSAIYWPPLQFLLKTQSLSLKEWLWIVSFGFLNLLAVELVKLFLLLKKKPV
ncbi:HAD-IC family P-type ATPase [Patescibacteria group bacterium]|nr:HAD-IC family P-type ATPase [Patescibacteria group bacterium]